MHRESDNHRIMAWGKKGFMASRKKPSDRESDAHLPWKITSWLMRIVLIFSPFVRQRAELCCAGACKGLCSAPWFLPG